MRRHPRSTSAQLFLLAAFLCSVNAAAATQEPILLRADAPFEQLGGRWSFLHDESSVATIEDVQTRIFTPEAESEPSFGFGGVVYWARFAARAATRDGAWILECAYPPMDLVELYTVRGGTVLSVQQAGDTIPNRLHPLPARTYRFRLAVDEASATTFYIRMSSQGPMHAAFRVWEKSALEQRDLRDLLVVGLYFGLMAVMAFLGVFVFFSSRDLSYLYYVGYIVSHALFQSTYLGVSNHYLWPGSAWWANTSLVVFASLAMVFSALFTRQFLQRGKQVPGLRYVIDACLAFSVLNFVAAFAAPYAVSILVTNLDLIVLSGVYIVAGALTLRRGYTPARYYLIAWTVLLVSVLWLALANFGIVPMSGFTPNPLRIGSVFEVLFLSLAIFDRIAHLREVNVAAERQLRESRERELRATEERLYFDSLTGLPNRTRLVADEASLRSPTLFLLNVDHFKEVNDFYGNKIGDQVLVELKRRIQTLESPLPRRLYRLHADEYALVLEGDLSPSACLEHGARLHAACTSEPFGIAGQRVKLNCSIGVSQAKSALLEQADMALAESRTHGSSVRIYDPSMETMKRYADNLRWVALIQDALKADAVFPHFQPIRDNATGALAKYECLIRLRTDDGRIIPPGEFLGVAKASKLYPELSRRVIRKSFAAFDGGAAEFSVNVSIEDIMQEETLAVIRECLARHDVKGRVVFEILESEGIHRYDIASSFIEAVKAEGCMIAIDDFGSGYSNFEHILRLKVDYLKLDSSLVKNLDTDRQAYAIVDTMQRFAERLGVKTIAEYVHNAAVQAAVERLGVHYSQGYYIGEPSPRLA